MVVASCELPQAEAIEASHFNEYLPDSQMGLNSSDTRRTMSHPLPCSALRKTEIGCLLFISTSAP